MQSLMARFTDSNSEEQRRGGGSELQARATRAQKSEASNGRAKLCPTSSASYKDCKSPVSTSPVVHAFTLKLFLKKIKENPDLQH
jgi:hypothetical protein